VAKKVLGLDFGDEKIIGVEVTRKGRTKVVTALGETTTPPGTILEGKILDEKSLRDALNRLLKEASFTAKATILGIDGTSFTIKTHSLPIMSERELERAIEFELPEVVNFPFQSLKDVSFDYYENKRTASEIEIVLVACQRSLINPYIEIAKGAGLSLEVIDLPALNWPVLPLEVNPRAFVNIEENWTTIFVELNGEFKVLRNIPLGRIHFQKGVEEAFQCSAAEAQRLCATKHIDYLLLEGPGNKSLLRANTQQFTASVFQTLDFVRAQERASHFSEILDELVLLGRLANLEGLPQVLQQETELKAYPLNPFANVSLDTGISPPDNGAVYASALALAWRGS